MIIEKNYIEKTSIIIIIKKTLEYLNMILEKYKNKNKRIIKAIININKY